MSGFLGNVTFLSENFIDSMVIWKATSVTGNVLWLRASNINIANGATVSTWADKSGNGNNATTMHGAPIYITASSNGQPAVRFAGAGTISTVTDHMQTVVFTQAQPFTYWLVMKSITFLANAQIVSDHSAATPGVVEQDHSSPTIVQYSLPALGGDCSDLAIGSYGIVQVVFDGSSSFIQVGAHAAVNGPSVGTAGISNGLDIGAYINGTFGCNMEVSEILMYNNHQGSADTASVLAGLTSLYGAGV